LVIGPTLLVYNLLLFGLSILPIQIKLDFQMEKQIDMTFGIFLPCKYRFRDRFDYAHATQWHHQ